MLASPSPQPHRPQPRPRSPAAFTLIELILIIAIVALLVALLLPSLGSVRSSARDVVAMSRMRQHASVFTVYSLDWDDYSPYQVHPDATTNIFRGGGLVWEVEYFWATEFWQIGIADAYYDGAVYSKVFRHPDARESYISFRMTSSFLADPRYWVEAAERDTSLWRGVRVTETRFPSQKAWLVEFHPIRGIPVGVGNDANSKKGVGLAFVDGHAGRFDGTELITPLQYGDGYVPYWRSRIGFFGMHTPKGVHGRDTR